MPPRRLSPQLAPDMVKLGTNYAPEDQVQSRLLLDVVVAKSAAILKLLAGKDKTLLVGRNATDKMSQ